MDSRMTTSQAKHSLKTLGSFAILTTAKTEQPRDVKHMFILVTSVKCLVLSTYRPRRKAPRTPKTMETAPHSPAKSCHIKNAETKFIWFDKANTTYNDTTNTNLSMLCICLLWGVRLNQLMNQYIVCIRIWAPDYTLGQWLLNLTMYSDFDFICYAV